MQEISQRLLYYKRKEVQAAIVEAAADREVGLRYGLGGFGKRPDTLEYDTDVLESVKKGATSFHLSEERWANPLSLTPGMRRADQDDNRIGWDLVLDIDCPYWKLSKMTAYLFVRALKMHKIKTIGCKFSGNKGFHICVPYEAFPEEVNGVPVKQRFPEGPKEIALYLLHFISKNLIDIEGDVIIFDKKYKTTLSQIAKNLQKQDTDLVSLRCPGCNKRHETAGEIKEFICSKCTYTAKGKGNYIICPKCNSIIKSIIVNESCSCGSAEKPKEMFEPATLVDLDTLLISSRHLFRAPYSLHEKSGLVSVPFDPDQVLKFSKEMALPENVHADIKFIDREGAIKNEGTWLMINAFDLGKELFVYSEKESKESQKEFEVPTEAIPKEYFPESINKGLQGLRDGKKRFLFILLNFLSCIGWSKEMCENLVLEWNSKNPEPLRENYLLSQMRHFKPKPIPPPNYSTGIYKELGIEDSLAVMKRYKNPVTYTKSLYKLSKRKNANKAQRVQGAKR